MQRLASCVDTALGGLAFRPRVDLNHRTCRLISSPRRVWLRLRLAFLAAAVAAILDAAGTSWPAWAHGSVDQSFTINRSNGWNQVCTGLGGWNAQTFTPTRNNIVAFDLIISAISSAATFSITDFPNTANVLATAPAVNFPPGVKHFDLPAPLPLNPGQKYAIMITSGQVCLDVEYFSADANYAGGAGVNWHSPTEDPNIDIAFTAYSTPTNPLTVVIDSGPVSPTNSRDTTLAFHSVGGAGGIGFQCRLDGGAWSPCASPAVYTNVGDGSHTFEVTASDTGGGTSSAGFNWTVDATPPDTIIDSMPLDPVNSTSATFSFHATDPSSTVECELDGLGFNPCGSPATFTGLADGRHTFRARAVDQLGNVDPTPAEFSWTVDTTAPNTVIDSGPGDPSRSNSATFSFHGSEPGSFACSLDGAPPVVCTSPVTYSGLAEGTHTFSVTETDSAGNQQATPVTFAWDIDATPPAVSCATADTLWHATKLTLVVTAPARRFAIITNIAGVTSGSPDVNPANNGAFATTRTR